MPARSPSCAPGVARAKASPGPTGMAAARGAHHQAQRQDGGREAEGAARPGRQQGGEQADGNQIAGGHRRLDQDEAGGGKGTAPGSPRNWRGSPAPKRRISGDKGIMSQRPSRVSPVPRAAAVPEHPAASVPPGEEARPGPQAE